MGDGIFVKTDRNKFKTLRRENLHSQIETRSAVLRLGLAGGEDGPEDIANSQEIAGVQIIKISQGPLAETTPIDRTVLYNAP